MQHVQRVLDISQPKRKLKHYVSRVQNKNKHPVIINIGDAKIVNIHSIDNNKLLRIWLPRDSTAYKEIADVDIQCLSAIIKNNSKWFKNDLDEIAIKNYYRDAINATHGTFIVAVLPEREPVITLNGNIIELDAMPKQYDIMNMEIEVQGLYFYETKCGVRWMLRKLVLTTHDDDLDPCKHDIEEQWRRDVDDLREKVATNCKAYAEKSMEFVERAENTLSDLQNIDPGEAWNSKCHDLAKIILEYNRFAHG